MYKIKAKKIAEAEKIAGDKNNKLKITLQNGEVLVGWSWGIDRGIDDDGEELDYDVLVFLKDGQEDLIDITDEMIKKVELANR